MAALDKCTALETCPAGLNVSCCLTSARHLAQLLPADLQSIALNPIKPVPADLFGNELVNRLLGQQILIYQLTVLRNALCWAALFYSPRSQSSCVQIEPVESGLLNADGACVHRLKGIGVLTRAAEPMRPH